MPSNYVKGRRREYRVQQVLERAGYQTVRAASSKGFADVIAVRGSDVRFISVKSGSAYCSALEREQLTELKRQGRGAYSVEIWRFPIGCRGAATIEEL